MRPVIYQYLDMLYYTPTYKEQKTMEKARRRSLIYNLPVEDLRELTDVMKALVASGHVRSDVPGWVFHRNVERTVYPDKLEKYPGYASQGDNDVEMIHYDVLEARKSLKGSREDDPLEKDIIERLLVFRAIRQGLPRYALDGGPVEGILDRIRSRTDIEYETVVGYRWVDKSGAGIAIHRDAIDNIEEGTIITTDNPDGALFFAPAHLVNEWYAYFSRYDEHRGAYCWMIETQTPTIHSVDLDYSELAQCCARTIKYLKRVPEYDC